FWGRLTMEVTVCDPEHDLYLRLPQGSAAQVAILQAGSLSVGEVEFSNRSRRLGRSQRRRFRGVSGTPLQIESQTTKLRGDGAS
ncbi:MAG: hypothetical protein OXM62_09405, partial [bacterium]|nr:hypothetical protein [bacterium]